MKYYGLWYGAYPFDTLTVVHSQRNSNTKGMEYPTFITVGTSFWPGIQSLDPEFVPVHEFGHNFWAIMVGNNEFEEAWLDEGFNTYSTRKVLNVDTKNSMTPSKGYGRRELILPVRPPFPIELR